MRAVLDVAKSRLEEKRLAEAENAIHKVSRLTIHRRIHQRPMLQYPMHDS
jgi:hypothetical protein